MSSANTLPPQRVGITGARGVLGRSLQAHCTGIEWAPFPGDVRCPDEIKSWLRSSQPLDAIFHLAALVPTHLVDSDPPQALRINVEGTCNVLQAIRTSSEASSRPWVFLSSSSHVYASSNQPLAEDSPAAPVTLYGLTKLQAEHWALAFWNKFDLPVCVGRIFSYTSRWQANSYFIPSLINRITEAPLNATLEIPGLLGSRDFLTTKLISQAIQRLFECRATGVVNIASGTPLRLLDIATELQRRLARPDIKIVPLDAGTHHLNADVKKLAGLGIRLPLTLDELLDDVLAACEDPPVPRVNTKRHAAG